jgi:hypothetical protein
VAQEDDDLLDGPPVLRVDFAALLAQQHEVVAQEVAAAHQLPQVELVLQHSSQPVEVECLVRVIVVSAHLLLQGGTSADCISVGQVVARRRPHLLVLRLELAAPSHVRN